MHFVHLPVESQFEHPAFALKLQFEQKEPLKYNPDLQVKQEVDLMQVWHEEWHMEQLEPKYPSMHWVQNVELVHFRQLSLQARHFCPPDT